MSQSPWSSSAVSIAIEVRQEGRRANGESKRAGSSLVPPEKTVEDDDQHEDEDAHSPLRAPKVRSEYRSARFAGQGIENGNRFGGLSQG